MKLTDVLSINSIDIKDNVESKESLIRMLIDNAAHNGNITDKNAAFSDVIAREKIMSTGVGKGIALPHAKTNHIKSATCSLALIHEPIDYQSLDDMPVQLCILLLSKSSNISLHLKMLSQISRLLNNDSLRNQILESNTREEIYEVIRNFEESSSKS